MEKGDETLASPPAAAEKTAPIGGAAVDDIADNADGHPAKSYAAVAAEKTAPNGGVAEDEVAVPATKHPVKSYAEVAAEKTSTNGSVTEDEVTAPQDPAKSVPAEKTTPNGSVAEDEVTDTTAVNPAKTYATVAANAEIEHLRTTNLKLQEKIADAERENKDLATEAHLLEGIFSQGREDVATSEYSAASSEEEVVSLREELKQLQDLLKAENGDYETDKRNSEQLAGKVGYVRQVKVRLQGEIKYLKEKAEAAAAAAAAPADETGAAPASGASEESGFAWPGKAGAAAACAVAAAVAVLLYLRLKR